MSLNFNNFMEVLPKAITGWISVFVVIAVIVVVVEILNKVTKK